MDLAILGDEYMFHEAKEWFENTGETVKLETYLLESKYMHKDARAYIAGILSGKIKPPVKPMAQDYKILKFIKETIVPNKRMGERLKAGIIEKPNEEFLLESPELFTNIDQVINFKKPRALNKFCGLTEEKLLQDVMTEFGKKDIATVKTIIYRARKNQKR